MSEYTSQFLRLKCSGDVLNCVSKMSKPEKEISESMAMIKQIKKIVLPEPMKYTVIDLCAGNALTSVLSCFMLPVKNAVAIDRKKRKGHYGNVKRFNYTEGEIDYFNYCRLDNQIMIAVHPCKTANTIVDIFNVATHIKHLLLMPCCNANYQDVIGYGWLREVKNISAYDMWTLHLANKIKGATVRITTDINCLSPKNNIIIARRI